MKRFYVKLMQQHKLWAQRSKTRKELSQLPIHLLQDLGLEQEIVRKEISKNPWQK